jgi:hypothetical protein
MGQRSGEAATQQPGEGRPHPSPAASELADPIAGIATRLGLSKTEVAGRGLHSSTFQLNLGALYGIRGSRRGCVARVEGVSGGM